MHAVGWPVAQVLDDEEEQAAIEDDVEYHVGVAALVLHDASLCSRLKEVIVDLLGRDDELRTVHAFLDRPAAAGMAGLVLEGEAGIGKSTIWLAGVEAARERGLRVLSARPAEVESGVAYAALGDLIEEALPEVLAELPAPRRRALETALLMEDSTGEAVDARTFAVAVRHALQLLAERRSTVVAVDDVQWLDASSASALAFALRRLPDHDVRVLFARRAGAAVSDVEQAIDDHKLERVQVGSLSPGALHAILHPRLGRTLARPTLLRVHEASGGNPFYALELARGLGASHDPTRPLPVPESLDALVRARLEGLPEVTRRALLLACTHGRLRPAQLDVEALEARLRGRRDRAHGRGDPFHTSSACFRPLPGGDAGG